MTADILLFTPRSNQKADRAFWKGDETGGIGAGDGGTVLIELGGNSPQLADTAPSEMNMDEPA